MVSDEYTQLASSINSLTSKVDTILPTLLLKDEYYRNLSTYETRLLRLESVDGLLRTDIDAKIDKILTRIDTTNNTLTTKIDTTNTTLTTQIGNLKDDVQGSRVSFLKWVISMGLSTVVGGGGLLGILEVLHLLK